MFFGWAAAGAAIVILLWWVKPDRAPDDIRLMVQQAAETVQTKEDAGTRSQVTEVSQPSHRGTDPNEGLERLTDSITYMESQLKIAREVTDSVVKAEQKPALSTSPEGPWVINLASSSSKAAAEHLAEKARSRGIQTQQQPVTVKGKRFWRVQITGFTTEEQASAYADTAREKLGLKDIWIMKR